MGIVDSEQALVVLQAPNDSHTKMIVKMKNSFISTCNSALYFPVTLKESASIGA